MWSQGGGRRWLFLAAAVAFYACKSKPSAFVIPLVSAVFLALNFKKFKKGAWVLAAFFAVLVFGAVFFGRELWGLAQSLRWENIPRMLFLNTENEFEPERSLALFDIKSVVPVSLARNLNFFFLWLVIFSVALLFKKGRFRFEKPVQFVWLWFAAEAASFAFADSAPRYLTDILLPAVILMCVLFQKACDELRSKKRRLVFGAVFLAGFLFGVIGNVQHLIFLRDWKIGYFYSLSKPAQVIWNHENRRPLDARVPIETLVPFAWPALTSEIDATLLQGSPRKKKSPEVTLPELLAFSDLADMYPASYDPQRARAFSSGREVVYGVSFKEETPKGFSVLTSLPAVPPSPITDALKGFKHKKRNERLWIFVRGA
ncbi:MAG: hypothetical protein HYZ87_01580 [Candidatus Omnitrophica bacterium]|nr:hypothetical protein [Candidatus Omnitrophota bacterium]